MQTALTVAKWYERERWPYAGDRFAIDELAFWVKKVDWKFFGTFTFAWEVSDQQAENVFAAFIVRLERHLRCEVCFIRGDEKTFSGSGKPATGRHFHALLTCVAPVNANFIASLWKSMAGTRQKLLRFDYDKAIFSFCIAHIHSFGSAGSFSDLPSQTRFKTENCDL